jgi:hypothetical protein
MASLTVNFSDGYADYQILTGALKSTGGNPGACVEGSLATTSEIRVRVNLPCVSTINPVLEFEFWKSLTPVFYVFRRLELYNADNQFLGSGITIGDDFTNGIWRKQGAVVSTVPNVAYFIIIVRGNGTSPVQVRLDNCIVKYQPQPDLTIQQQEADQQQALNNVFTAIRDTLQADATADITDLVTDYQGVVQNAFRVSFTYEVEGGDPTKRIWGLLGIHFTHQALEAIAQAFERWTESEIERQGVCYTVDRYALFRRILGGVEFQNVAQDEDYVAETFSPVIKVYFNAERNYQWVMIKNNVIHELGHVFDGRAGFGMKWRGSIEYSVDDYDKGGGPDLHRWNDQNHTRAGMTFGLNFMRQVSNFEHSEIGGSPDFFLPANVPPFETDSGYDLVVPAFYIFYEVAQENLSVWRMPLYNGRYGDNTRIDTLVQNAEQSATECAADSFLNWIYNAFANAPQTNPDDPEEENADNWQAFYASNIGMFLRNAASHNGGGMLQHYQVTLSQANPSLPMTPLSTGNRSTSTDGYRIRLTPDTSTSSNVLGVTNEPESENVLPAEDVEIYGWKEPIPPMMDDPDFFWLLVRDKRDRLVWVSYEGVVGYNADDVKGAVSFNETLIAPDRSYEDSDLSLIVGE